MDNPWDLVRAYRTGSGEDRIDCPVHPVGSGLTGHKFACLDIGVHGFRVQFKGDDPIRAITMDLSKEQLVAMAMAMFALASGRVPEDRIENP